MKSDTSKPAGVVLTHGETGSSILYGALSAAVAEFPRDFDGFSLPALDTFKRSFGEAVVRFEACRVASANRVAIARRMVAVLDGHLHHAGAGTVPLREHLAQARSAPRLEVVARGASSGGYKVEIPWRREHFRGAAGLATLADRLLEGSLATERVHRALHWVSKRLDGDRLDLRGERFALLGAGAELAPTGLLLEAGADVLWIDRQAFAGSAIEKALAGRSSGTLHAPVAAEGGSDLLADPGAALAAVRSFREAGGPIHLGLLAYAPGKGRELRLAGAMDAMTRTLPSGVAKSVALYVSPTTPGEVQPEDRRAAAERRAKAPLWVKLLERTGGLKPNAHHEHGRHAISRTIVTVQGPTYQAAQYIAKMLAAEVLLADGIGGEPVTVSANVAGITATRSLQHPLFQAAFIGAPRFGVEIFEPETTRALSGLLMVHDALNPEAVGASSHAGHSEHASPIDVRAQLMASQSLHGGARSLPWHFDHTIRMGAVIGLGQKPKLIGGLLPKLGKKKKKKS